MIEKVEYIKSIFRIDVDNLYLITDIAEELIKIEDFDDFRKWLKINLNHYDAQYLKPYEKFIFLTRIYLKARVELLNSERISKSRNHAFILAEKVRAVSGDVENYGLKCENFRANGENYFTSFESSQLKKLGGLYSCVKLQKSVSGSDALLEKLEQLAYKLIVNNIIEYKSEDTMCDKAKNRLEKITKKM